MTAPVLYPPTDEQARAIELFSTGHHLVIEAGAGTGKTSTLLHLAASAPQRRGQYVAFNKAIVVETGQKLDLLPGQGHPHRAQARTAHSLAMRAVGRRYAHRLNSGRIPSGRLAAMLGMEPLKITTGDQVSYLSPAFLAGQTMRGIAVFCNSADPEPTRRHVPYVEGIDMPDAAGRPTWANNDLVRDHLAPYLRRAWADISSVNGQLRFEHDHYLKLWELSGPTIDADYIMFDEAQDASPVMLSIVQQQAARGVQVVYVGDTQQQIYEWRGAINALARVGGGAERTFLTQSFRFGAAVAAVANRCLGEIEGAELQVKGYGPIASEVRGLASARAVLCRTNSEAVRRVITAQAEGRRPYLVGEGRDVLSFARAVDALRTRGSTEHPELACFTSWGQVQDYVDHDPQGSDLKLLVRLVDEFGTATIITALSNPTREVLCDLVVSTAHKAKGREWESVQLASDFPDPAERGDDDSEWRLLYVAVTRAQLVLDIEAVAALADEGPARVDASVPDDASDLDYGSGLGYGRPTLG
jgi:hypothetical protein